PEGAESEQLDRDTRKTAIVTMAMLNRAAAEAMRAVGIGPDDSVHGATDITGFGLLGHLSHGAPASGVCPRIDSPAVPLLPRARERAKADFTTGGGAANARYLDEMVT